VEDVVVTGRSTDVRTSIDSISYSLADDLQAATGSLADALRNVPSVDVDPQGNVSLRGDGNVTILIDGRPSGILSGEGRAQAIQQMQANQFSRVEVMTNPSAAYSPEGSGGVINLISRPNRPAAGGQRSGSVRANVGDHGRWNVGVSGSQVRDKLTLSTDLGVRADLIEQEVARYRLRPDSGTGLFAPSVQTQAISARSTSLFGRLGAEYNLSDRTQASLEVRGSNFDNEGSWSDEFEGRNASGVVNSAYLRDSDVEQGASQAGVTAQILQRFDGEGHEWTNEVRFDEGENGIRFASEVNPVVPGGPTTYETVDNGSSFGIIALTSAYVRPMGEAAKLRLGYELEIRTPEVSNSVSRGASAAAQTPVAGLTNRFKAEQTVNAIYATYERPLTSKLSGQFGLRLEQADIHTSQITTGATSSQDYFRAYPTFHLSYQLSDAQTLRGSYSRRIQRPQPAQLNPFVAYVDAQNLRSGNPDLEPQTTDAFEALWQMRSGQTFYQATAYYRDTQGAFTEVATIIGGGVLLVRPENLGARRDIGLEIVANGRLLPTLQYSASVNAYRQKIETIGLAGAEDRSGTQVSGRLNLNWVPNAKDFLQIGAIWNGDTLLAQGVRESGSLLNLGYRRKLTDTLALQLTVRDLLDDFGDVTVYDTPQFRDRTVRQFGGRAGYIGLTWSLGSGPRRQQDPQFDFGASPAGG